MNQKRKWRDGIYYTIDKLREDIENGQTEWNQFHDYYKQVKPNDDVLIKTCEDDNLVFSSVIAARATVKKVPANYNDTFVLEFNKEQSKRLVQNPIPFKTEFLKKPNEVLGGKTILPLVDDIQHFLKTESITNPETEKTNTQSQPKQNLENDFINLNSDWEKFTAALNDFSLKFAQHAYHYTNAEEKEIQYHIFDKLVEKFDDWERDDRQWKAKVYYEFHSNNCEDATRKSNRKKSSHRFDFIIYANETNNFLLSIVAEIKLIGAKTIHDFIKQATNIEGHTVWYDIDKINTHINGNQEIKVRSGAIIVFTNISVKEYQEVLANTFKQQLGEYIRMFVIGNDGLIQIN